MGHGELWCARLFAASMRLKGHKAMMLDAREVLVVDPTPDGQSVDVEYEASEANLDKWASINGDPDVIIATGFIARDKQKQVRPEPNRLLTSPHLVHHACIMWKLPCR